MTGLYRPVTDRIHLPHKHQFETPDRYYATALHELGQLTGHESRLNRDLSSIPLAVKAMHAKNQSRDLSMLLGHELGLGHPGQLMQLRVAWAD